MSHMERLQVQLEAVAPCVGFSMDNGRVVSIDFKDATEDQRRAAKVVADAYDFSAPLEKPAPPLSNSELKRLRAQWANEDVKKEE